MSLSSVGIDGVIGTHSPKLVRPMTQSAACIFSSLDLPKCYLDELCSDRETFKFFLTVDLCVLIRESGAGETLYV